MFAVDATKGFAAAKWQHDAMLAEAFIKEV
jgi:hypothetical protein